MFNIVLFFICCCFFSRKLNVLRSHAPMFNNKNIKNISDGFNKYQEMYKQNDGTGFWDMFFWLSTIIDMFELLFIAFCIYIFCGGVLTHNNSLVFAVLVSAWIVYCIRTVKTKIAYYRLKERYDGISVARYMNVLYQIICNDFQYLFPMYIFFVFSLVAFLMSVYIFLHLI